MWEMSREERCEKWGKYMTIKSFLDLDVYQNLYKTALIINKDVIPKLPPEEKFNLYNQMKRASMAAPTLIAEGYAKKNYKKGWKKYLDDSLCECNEMIVHLSFVKSLYSRLIDSELCDKLINIYNISGKQLYRLKQSWRNYSE